MVSKRADRPYRTGRSKDWVKIKNRKHPAYRRVQDQFYNTTFCRRQYSPRSRSNRSECEFPEILVHSADLPCVQTSRSNLISITSTIEVGAGIKSP